MAATCKRFVVKDCSKYALPPLAAGMVALFAPPAAAGPGLAAWLAGALAVTYAAFSLATINHQAWGAELSADAHQRTRITATREGLALAGVMIAAILPGLFVDTTTGMHVLSWSFAGALLVCKTLAGRCGSGASGRAVAGRGRDADCRAIIADPPRSAVR